jgi:isopenicillin N synthase-like dioxygenase
MRLSRADAPSRSYKGIGYSKVDTKGTPDRCEFWGISKDHIMGLPDQEDLPQILQGAQSSLRLFVEHFHFICQLIMAHINVHLGLPSNTLAPLHDLHQSSADQARFLKMPPQPEGDRRTSLLAHTDVGSITMVWNVLGGLQVQRPDVPYNSDEGWEFIKPERGCAVVNMGDAMRRFTGDRVRSSLYRVAYAPGDQATHNRYSVAYFSRPLNSMEVKPLDFGDKDAVLANGKGTNFTDAINITAQLYFKGRIPLPTYST